MSSNPQAPKSDPSLRPTSISALIVAGLAAAAAGLAAAQLLLLGAARSALVAGDRAGRCSPIAEGLLAQNTGARIQRKPGTLPVDPLAVARYVALAKASSLVGALSAGFSAGLLAWLAMEPHRRRPRDDLPTAGRRPGRRPSLLIGAALWLERVLPDPGPARLEGRGRPRTGPTGHR